MKIDICIPTCSPNALDLIMTLQSCERALQYSGLDYLYHIASNGTPSEGPARKSLNCGVHYAKNTGRLGHVFDVPAPLNPAGGRNLAASAGTGEVIFFLDDHCMIHENFFTNALLTHQATGAASKQPTHSRSLSRIKTRKTNSLAGGFTTFYPAT